MNKKQIFVLAIGIFFIIIHLILYFPLVQAKYEKLRYERQRLKTDYSQPVLDTLKDREGTFQRVLFAWAVVSIFIVFGTGSSLWIYRKRRPPTAL